MEVNHTDLATATKCGLTYLGVLKGSELEVFITQKTYRDFWAYHELKTEVRYIAEERKRKR